MTREEIIQGLQFTIDMFLSDPLTGEPITKPRNDMDKTTIDACKGAIELLTQEPCEDAISRADALSEISSYFITDEDENGTTYQMAYEDGVNAAYEAVEKLPLVTSKQKMGHWIHTSGYNWHCSECDFIQHESKTEYKYCPNCGAKMVKPQESEDKE